MHPFLEILLVLTFKEYIHSFVQIYYDDSCAPLRLGSWFELDMYEIHGANSTNTAPHPSCDMAASPKDAGILVGSGLQGGGHGHHRKKLNQVR